MLVSVVVLAWNNEGVIDSCLDAIAKLDWPELEVVVVDNGSTDSTPELLRRRTGIRVVTLPRNRGFAGGQVAAAPYIKGELVALVNSDAIVSTSWLRELIAEIGDDVGVVGGRAYDWDGTTEGLARRDGYYSYQVIDPVIGAATTLRCGDVPTDVNSISGAAVLIRVSALEQAGGFDARFFCYYEETDLFARMRRNGWRVRYVPTAEVWHEIRASSRKDPSFYEFYMLRNRALCALMNFDRAFLPPFLARYLGDAWRRLRHRGNGGRMVLRVLFHLLLLSPHIWLQRRRLPKGTSYNVGLAQDEAPVVTIAVTCYNHEAFVAEAIASALAQSSGVADVVVVDDGSTDESWREISSFGDKVHAVRTENGGVVAARNVALSLCQSEWLLYLDSDDRLPPDYVERLLVQARLRALDVAYGDARYFGSETGLLPGEPFDRYSLADHNFIHCSALLRHAKVVGVGGFKPQMAGGYEDWELYMSLYEQGSRFGYVPGVELGYRRHPRMTSRNVVAGRNGAALRELVKRLHPNLFEGPPYAWLRTSVVWRVARRLLGPARRRFKAAVMR